MLQTTTPLQAKNSGADLRVLIIGRISTEHQDLENIEASYRYVEEHLRRNYKGPMHIKHLGERASGMLSDRVTIREAEDLIAGGGWDVVIAEDLSRIFRNPRHQYNFVQDAVDAGTRVIAIADNLDTADSNWELMLGAATLRHGLVVSDTRRRVRRTATHSFHRGGMVMKVKCGYRKLTSEESHSGQFGPQGLMIAKRPKCTPVICQMVERVLRGDSYAAVSDWLNTEGIEPPPYSKGHGWTGRRVQELLADPILCGQRSFRRTVFEPIFKTGKHKRLKNEQPEIENYPELAHVTPAEHEVLLQVIRRREQGHRHLAGAAHPLTGRPRSRSIWPAQHARCGICGGLMYRYDRDMLKCQNAHRRDKGRCWNHVQVSCEIARKRILSWLLDQFEEQRNFRDVLIDSAQAEFDRVRQRAATGKNSPHNQIAELERQADNLANAIAQGGRLDPLLDRLKEVNRLLAVTQQAYTETSNECEPQALSHQEIADQLDASIWVVARRSQEFAALMQRTITEFVILPIQAVDSGLVRPQARFILAGALFKGIVSAGVETNVADGVAMKLELFDRPLHLRHLDSCLSARREIPTPSFKEIAERLGISNMTVKRALDYANRLTAEGRAEPYRELTERPGRASRWKHGVCNA